MRGLSKGVDLITFTLADSDGYRTCQLAVDGVLAIPFSFPSSHMDKFPTEESLASYLERQARMLIDRYGDYRYQRRDEATSPMSQVA